MEVLRSKKETYKKRGELEKSIRVTELLRDKDGELTIAVDGKPRRVFNFTLNSNDKYDEELFNWIFEQEDLSTSVKRAVKFYIKNA